MTTHGQSEQAAPIAPHTDRLLWDTRLSIFHYPALAVADELGLFAAVDAGQVSVEALAAKLGVARRAAEILGNIVWGLGFLENTAGRLALTATAREYLLPASRFYWGNVLAFYRSRPEYQEFLAAVRRDGAELAHHGQTYSDMWEAGSIDEAAAANFTDRMHSYILAPAEGAAASRWFAGLPSIVDIGGGSGAFCIALAQSDPALRVAIFDLPAVCKVAERYLTAAGLQARVATLAGNFCHDPLPTGFAAMLFSNIFHDWGKERCAELARKAFAALPSGGKVFLHEMVFDPSQRGPLTVSCFSMLMFMAHPGGQQYSFAELAGFLRAAGFASITLRPAFGYYSLVEGVKP